MTGENFRKDSGNKDFIDFQRNPNNYSLLDATHWVYGPEFWENRIYAIESMTDADEMKLILEAALYRCCQA